MSKEISLKGIFDMHVHTAPDIRERRYTDFDLVDAAVRVGARAIVIKSHHGFTMNRAYLCNLYAQKVYGDTNFTMYGGIVLNNAVGGLNPVAVETALKMGAKEIWLPTVHARNQMEKNGKSGGIEAIDEFGHVVQPLQEIFRLAKEYNVAIGTGHLSASECFVVVDAARKAGVDKIIVTHPEFWVVGMTLEEQERIVRDYDVILEKCFRQPIGGGVYKSNLEGNLEAIQRIGSKNIMCDTDGGQVQNPAWELALGEYVQYLADNGVSEADIKHMTQEIPAWLLDVEL